MGKTIKKNTAVQDLLEWIDRVEERGITQLSTEKIRERIKERIPLEKERMVNFAIRLQSSSSPAYDLFNQEFSDKNQETRNN